MTVCCVVLWCSVLCCAVLCCVVVCVLCCVVLCCAVLCCGVCVVCVCVYVCLCMYVCVCCVRACVRVCVCSSTVVSSFVQTNCIHSSSVFLSARGCFLSCVFCSFVRLYMSIFQVLIFYFLFFRSRSEHPAYYELPHEDWS